MRQPAPSWLEVRRVPLSQHVSTSTAAFFLTAARTHSVYPVAQLVESALAAIQPETATPQPAPPASLPNDAAYAREIEAFCCCLRSQSGHLSDVRRFVAATSSTGHGIDLWTGYSTILSIIGKLLRKVPRVR